ncbi:dihydroorotate dehydrogenase electron transfer subunit [Caproiciproducens sp. NJN-50]|uniref:dihydroorotate dehydrogenase electron transfer subunit n=1 Tax=Acutalibacteraceae TaxID=3082771 RepID=UPI000FFE282E|nr:MULTISPECIES: dihydroorotate dehydrogenase electron transfer subunit [Acutalibacteraceae]QAT50815.1 dihydroorotate dehydrogenase electron transfer subunit [Caproiciproducens sp. NJN-50]
MKRYDTADCAVLKKAELAPGIFDLTVFCPEAARIARPGQFAQFQVPGKTLRRPISICEISREDGTLRFVFQIRGDGTRLLSLLNPGETVNLLAPLGNGFDLGDPSRRALFVGGGIGVPPLLEAAKPFGARAVLAAGFRSRNAVTLREDFESLGCQVRVATDDGSFGYHGLVADLMDDIEFDVVFACGPKPMLRAAAGAAARRGVPCYVSMEERMACGIGACLGCAVRLRGGNGPYYGHVCKDGPVFDARTVVWEE